MSYKEINLRSSTTEGANTEIMYEIATARADLIDLIRIKTGLKERRFAVLRVESAKRLQDKTYAHQLLSAGYNVPEEYL